jgi:hypothetical protein
MNLSLFVTIGQFALIIPLIYILVRWKKLPNECIWILLLLILWLVTEVILYVTRINNISNIWVLYFITPFQMFILFAFFSSILKKRKIMLVLMLAGLTINFLEYFYKPTGLNSVSQIYQCLIITIVGIYTYYKISKDDVESRWTWMIGAITFFFMGSGIYFSAFILMDNFTLLKLLGIIHIVRLLITYGLFTLGVWKL